MQTSGPCVIVLLLLALLTTGSYGGPPGPTDGCACNEHFMKICANACDEPDACCRKDELAGLVPSLDLLLETATTSARTTVRFYKKATQGYDTAYDAPKLEFPDLGLFSLVAEKKLVINTLPYSGKEIRVPLQVNAAVRGSYTWQFTGGESFPGSVKISLIDKESNVATDVKMGSYTFTTAAFDSPSRFELLFENMPTDNALSLPGGLVKELKVYFNSSERVIEVEMDAMQNESAQLVMHTIDGMPVYQAIVPGPHRSLLQLPVRHLHPGYYLLSIETPHYHYRTKVSVQ